MTEIIPQQILIEHLKQITNNQELIDLAVTQVNSYQDVIRYRYGNVEVLVNTKDNTLIESDYSSFNDLLRVLAYNNIDKLTVIDSCQYPDLTEGCVRYLYSNDINVYYKITITKIKYSYHLTKDAYTRYQEFWFDYSTSSASAWDEKEGLRIYNIKPSIENAELFVTEKALLNKYELAKKMTL